MQKKYLIMFILFLPALLFSSPGDNLLSAINKGNIEGINSALKNGANINKIDSHNITPLIWAAILNKKKIVKLLVEKGAAVNYKNKWGFNALRAAKIDKGQTELIRILKEAGAKDTPVKKCKKQINIINPRDFFIHLYKLAKANNRACWPNQMSRRFNTRDSGFIDLHFLVWQHKILKFVKKGFGDKLNFIEAELVTSIICKDMNHHSLRVWNKKNPEVKMRITVVIQENGLRINEN
ncbi:MAG: ankyrin repeat domain-containing protein [bacterium]|nr:ankyrin repeat domain-containing protein [bacterium]